MLRCMCPKQAKSEAQHSYGALAHVAQANGLQKDLTKQLARHAGHVQPGKESQRLVERVHPDPVRVIVVEKR